MGLMGTATEDIGPAARRGPALVEYNNRTEVDRVPYLTECTSGPERGSHCCQ